MTVINNTRRGLLHQTPYRRTSQKHIETVPSNTVFFFPVRALVKPIVCVSAYSNYALLPLQSFVLITFPLLFFHLSAPFPLDEYVSTCEGHGCEW